VKKSVSPSPPPSQNPSSTKQNGGLLPLMRIEVNKHNRNQMSKDSPYLQSLLGGKPSQ
jgi:hypothetical protein